MAGRGGGISCGCVGVVVGRGETEVRAEGSDMVMCLKVRVLAHMPNLPLYSHTADANIQKVFADFF